MQQCKSTPIFKKSRSNNNKNVKDRKCNSVANTASNCQAHLYAEDHKWTCRHHGGHSEMHRNARRCAVHRN